MKERAHPHEAAITDADISPGPLSASSRVERVSSTITTELFLHSGEADPDQPGLVAVFSGNRPAFVPVALESSPIIVGRSAEARMCLPLDSSVSRQHASIRMDGDRLVVTDLRSRNGTFLDGKQIDGTVSCPVPRTLRVGGTVLVIVPRLGPFLESGLEVIDDVVVGPTLALVRQKLAQIAAAGQNVLLSGPTGVGKELAARYFHASHSLSSGPFVAVNCATIPSSLAERLLFGARRGAYSGADANVDGYVQAAHGGTLFLDEIAELEPAVQAKLLRVLETHEALPLGATHPQRVQFQTCAATLKDLRAEVAAGRFREDLYHRIGRPAIRIPDLRERAEEIPWLAAMELRRLDERLVPSAQFVEACLLREWPGNIREFRQVMQDAALEAKAEERTQLSPSHLAVSPTTSPFGIVEGGARVVRKSQPAQGDILATLREAKGNISKAARTLGMHRNQLRRWLLANRVDVACLREAPAQESAAEGGADPSRSGAFAERDRTPATEDVPASRSEFAGGQPGEQGRVAGT